MQQNEFFTKYYTIITTDKNCNIYAKIKIDADYLTSSLSEGYI